MRLIAWSRTDIGRKRDHNEDSHLVDSAHHLYAVADGMGGHQGGDYASRLAVEVLEREVSTSCEDIEAAAARILKDDPLAAVFPRDAPGLHAGDGGGGAHVMSWPTRGGVRKPGFASEHGEDEELATDGPTDPAIVVRPPAAATILRSAARAAGRAIFDAAQSDPGLAGMGTTLTALLFHRDRAHLVHVGDSRAFLFRDGRAAQITEDHSWIAEQVRAGVLSESEARESKFRHIITRSVGFEREVDVDLLGLQVLPGDCFLICSDGMSNYVEADELNRIVGSTYYAKIPALLVDLANDRGGDDNITVVVVYAGNEKSNGKGSG